MKNFADFASWKKYLSRREFLTDNPFEREPLGPDPVFLYSETITPLPSASMAGAWTCYPSAHKLAAHLRFGLLPVDFGIWLCRPEWDPTPEEPTTVEMLIAGARAAESRYVVDSLVMEKVVTQLDAALQADDTEIAWWRVQQACRIFNARWASTPTWNFVHKPLKGLRGLIKDMTARGIIDASDAEVRVNIAGALEDPKLQRQLKSLLKDTVVF